MAAIIGTEQTSVKATGVGVTVPDYDVCRLSYYLHCGTVACGVDILVDELVDYKNAHRLPKDRQDAIFRLAYDEFDLETLANKTIFLDDDNDILPRGWSNEFYTVEKASNVLAIQSNVLIAGKRSQVRKIMVCNENWLERYYVKPLQRYEARLKQQRSRASSATSDNDESVNLVTALVGGLALVGLSLLERKFSSK